jgi:GH24 family phage-related lysozyme (muramidase)
MNEYFALVLIGASSIQSLALIYVLIRMIGVTDRALARAQAPEAVGSTPPPPGPTPGKVVVPPAQPLPSPVPTPVVDEALVAEVKKFEGFSAKAYGDFKQWSIGYGTKASGPGETITESEADAALRRELAQAEASVEAFAPNAPKGVKQALADLTYNAGTKWQSASLGTHIKAGDYASAKASLLQYNHAGGEVNAGLTARREAEVKWFDNPL